VVTLWPPDPTPPARLAHPNGSLRAVEIDWPDVLIGFALGLTPVLLPPAWYFLRHGRSQQLRRLEGHWHLYYRFRRDYPELLRRDVDVSYSFWRRGLSIELQSKEGNMVAFRGTLRTGKGMFSAKLESVSGEEPAFLILNDRGGAIPVTTGLIVGANESLVPIAGPALLSRNEVESADLARWMPDVDYLFAKRRELD